MFAGLGPGYLVVGASVNSSDGSYQMLTPSQLVAKDINIQAGENTTIKASSLQAQDSLNISSPNLSISGEYQRSDSKNRGASAFVLVGPHGPVGGGAGINASYDKSGKYFAATMDAANINLNSPNQVIEGARINGQDINPHSDYSEGHQFSGGFGFGGGMPSVNFGFDDFSLAAGAGPNGGFGSIGFKEFSIGGNIDPTSQSFTLGGGVYGLNASLS